MWWLLRHGKGSVLKDVDFCTLMVKGFKLNLFISHFFLLFELLEMGRCERAQRVFSCSPKLSHGSLKLELLDILTALSRHLALSERFKALDYTIAPLVPAMCKTTLTGGAWNLSHRIRFLSFVPQYEATFPLLPKMFLSHFWKIQVLLRPNDEKNLLLLGETEISLFVLWSRCKRAVARAQTEDERGSFLAVIDLWLFLFWSG